MSAPDNGMIDCSLGGDGVPTNGDTCTFTCNDGFELSGSQSRRCRIRNNRGRWTGNPTTCNMGTHVMLFIHITIQCICEYKQSLLVKLSSRPSTV